MKVQKVQYLLTFPQIRAISLLAHIDGKFLSEEVNDRRLVEYNITIDQNFMLDSLLSQKGFVVKDETQWPSDGDKYYFIDNIGYILDSQWDMIDGTPTEVDISRRNIGNVFKTEEEAKFACERLKICNKLKNLSDDDQVWNCINPHYSIIYDSDHKKVDIGSFYYTKVPHEYWFKSKESAEAALKAIGEDKLKKYVFNIKE